MKTACWMIVLVVALGLASVAQAGQASTPDAFYGRYQGSGYTHDPNAALFGLGSRDLDVEIGPAEGGFFVAWTTVMQSPGDKGSKSKSSRVVFMPGGRPGLYLGHAEGTKTAEGMSWASIGDRTLTVRLLQILDDGSYEIQTYQRSLTDDGGMFVFFRSDLDGAVMKVVTAQLRKQAK